ncbi:MAG: pilus assembly protein PilZ [Gammaproteobacteria bacterium]|nr:MAG: pilus assembly protein PilZ [Gammaproteobacteria bacterium]
MNGQNKSNKTKKSNSDALAKRGVLKFTITDEKMLYNCYMPFIKGCGIFIPSKDEHQLGEEAFLLLNLPGDGGKFAASAKVVWLNPPTKLGRREIGIGLQILGRDAGKIREKIEAILGKKVHSPLPPYTM